MANSLTDIATHILAEKGDTIAETLGKRISLSPLSQQGNLNYTYSASPVEQEHPRWIVKVKDRASDEHVFCEPITMAFQMESFAISKLKDMSFQVPTIAGPPFEIGPLSEQYGPFAFSIQSLVPGTPGAVFAEVPLTELYKKIGRAAAEIHQNVINGFGSYLQENGQPPLHTWKEYLHTCWQATIEQSDSLLSSQEHTLLIQRFEALKAFRPAPCIIHSDLHLSNCLFDRENRQLTAIIDWEKARCSCKEEELARVLYEIFVLSQRYQNANHIRNMFREGMLPTEYRAFIEGYTNSTDKGSHDHYQVTSLLLLFSLRFYLQWEKEYQETRKDWRAPAEYARALVEVLLTI